MTLAAVDRLVHHSTIFEMNVESYRRRAAVNRKQHGPGRPAQYATPKNVGPVSPRDNQPRHDRLAATTPLTLIVALYHPDRRATTGTTSTCTAASERRFRSGPIRMFPLPWRRRAIALRGRCLPQA